MPLILLRFLTALWEALLAYGRLWVHIPDAPPATPGGPGYGHPERLCPLTPLTEEESVIWSDISSPYRSGGPYR
ncbi:DUF6059 family protein [Streptomyces sp. 2A115]|uniref:DUF6059 family protein n=1 Tax=Streptomyces sp. 2A115 TaxID=3457439 RepID=UPI003FCF60C2